MGIVIDQGARFRYTRVAIALHWTIALLILVNLLIGLLNESLPKGAIALHKSIGMTVLALSIVRLIWRLTHRPPPLPATVKPWEKGVAHLVHWLFYVLIILMPLSGWIFTSASPKRYPLSFFGLFALPPFPVPQDKAISGIWHDRHELLGYLMLALIALHVAAALKHRFVDGDGTVDRMLPGAGPA